MTVAPVNDIRSERVRPESLALMRGVLVALPLSLLVWAILAVVVLRLP
jgi:hypothetical protein